MGRWFTLGRAAWLLLAACATACASGGRGVREDRDVGLVCIESGGGQRLTFRVSSGDRCLSACDENVLSCSAALDGTRIELHSMLVATPIADEKGCIDLCAHTEGACTLDVPSAGDYQFSFASLVDTETLPTDESIPLFGEHPCEPQDSVPRLSQ